jgi:S-DNA-T family DNA segregation ATPase FtsK/SpoIIIE
LPNIVFCLDEFALLRTEKKIVRMIEDISAIGRALGVYLVMSMQRPDAEVITGKLKNNLTVRMAFRQSDAINSRVALGSKEAAKITVEQKGRFFLKLEKVGELQAPELTLDKAKHFLQSYKVEKPRTKDGGETAPESETISEETSVFGVLDE